MFTGKFFSRYLVALFLFFSLICYSKAQDTKDLPSVIVNSDPFESDETSVILSPAKVLYGEELSEKIETSLGDTLNYELGVSSSGFCAGCGTPVIRGLGGPRIMILQNGMGIGDVASSSDDHGVGFSYNSASQIEILRGPSSLLYGSGIIGGLVNVINNRIPKIKQSMPTYDLEARYSSVDNGSGFYLSGNGTKGNVSVHYDTSYISMGDYKIPGNSASSFADELDLNDFKRLTFSGFEERSNGFGATFHKDWGYFGASVSQFDKSYGVHGADEVSIIDMMSTKLDFESLINNPFNGIKSMLIKIMQSDYEHDELEDGVEAHARYLNDTTESRVEFKHNEMSGWNGKFGIHAFYSEYEVKSLEDPDEETSVPFTKSDSFAAFLVEEKRFGNLRLNVGSRLENVNRKPTGKLERDFNLASYSAGALYNFVDDLGIGFTYTVAQRAPSIEELYFNGKHHPTETYDIGDENLKKEKSNNLDFTIQTTSSDKLKWKFNIYNNSIDNFVYGEIPGTNLNDDEVGDRFFRQGDATLKGYEGEISFNLNNPGWFSRIFFDKTKGTLTNLGNLPLQPANRFGASFGYSDQEWRFSLNSVFAQAHRRLATVSEENETPSYTKVDLNLSRYQNFRNTNLTYFLSIKNLLDEEIRLSTSLLKDYIPQRGRSIVLGIRAFF